MRLDTAQFDLKHTEPHCRQDEVILRRDANRAGYLMSRPSYDACSLAGIGGSHCRRNLTFWGRAGATGEPERAFGVDLGRRKLVAHSLKTANGASELVPISDEARRQFHRGLHLTRHLGRHGNPPEAPQQPCVVTAKRLLTHRGHVTKRIAPSGGNPPDVYIMRIAAIDIVTVENQVGIAETCITNEPLGLHEGDAVRDFDGKTRADDRSR